MRAQGALTIGTLSEESNVFRSAIVDVGVVLMLVTLLGKAEDHEVQIGAALAVRAVAQNPDVTEEPRCVEAVFIDLSVGLVHVFAHGAQAVRIVGAK